MSACGDVAASLPAVHVDEIVRFITRALAAVGVSQEDARQVAALMAESDALGGDAHGVFRLPQYIKQIEDGAVNPRPKIQVLNDRAGAALIDGDNGLGHLVMKRATELAIEKARACGVGWVGTRRSNHAGPAQLYPRMAAAQNMIGLYFCVGNANVVPPWGGTESLLSTNPIAIAVPAAKHPSIVLDMATTNTAFGKVRLKAPSHYLQRFMYDTVVHSKSIMKFVISEMGAERIMIGSDYCLDMGYEQPVHFLDQVDMTSAQRKMISGDNAARLLKL
jgi:L-2-hydroxycarboxylate dehydrogenase (NAD+)